MNRILVYGFSEGRGGKEEYIINLCPYLKLKDIYFDYIIDGTKSHYYKEIKKYGGKIYYYKSKNKIDKIIKIQRIIKRNCKTHSHLYFNTSGLYNIFPILFGKKYGMKIIVHAHSAKEPRIKPHLILLNLFNRIIVNKITDIKIACSDLAKKWIFGQKTEAIQINNAIEVKRFIFDNKIREKYRNEIGIKPNDIVIINVGRLAYPKNQLFLIKLTRELGPNYKLLLVGDGPDLETIIKESNDRVLITKDRKDVNNLLMAADIFAMPSFFEGFPISAIEAQASGLPCILSNTITRQAAITKQVLFIDIDNIAEWKNGVLTESKNTRRENVDLAALMEYDVKNVSNKVAKIIKGQIA